VAGIALLDDQTVAKTELRLDRVSDVAVGRTERVHVNDAGLSGAVVGAHVIERGVDVAFGDHVPHRVDLLFAAQIEGDVRERRIG